MQKHPARNVQLLLLAVAVVLLQWFAADADRVERWYSRGMYPPFSRGLRIAFGWIPFSVGDLLYLAAALYLFWRAYRIFRSAWRRELRAKISGRRLWPVLRFFTLLYLVFMSFWGLNYSRRDIADQFGLTLQASDTARLKELAQVLQARLCTWGDRVDSLRRLRLLHHKTVFAGGVGSYRSLARREPFMAYERPSLKPSLISPMGHLFGFTGYYNPFTGEAQLHTGIPVFLRPFVICHEIGHQLGYAKENEANFAGFLAARASPDPEFVYSAYFEMYRYTLRELAATDVAEAWVLRRTAHEQFRRDYRAYRHYLLGSRNVVEPMISRVYDQYLKLNRQQQGIETYDEVVRWLLAYLKKYGAEAV